MKIQAAVAGKNGRYGAFAACCIKDGTMLSYVVKGESVVKCPLCGSYMRVTVKGGRMIIHEVFPDDAGRQDEQ